MIPRLFTKEAFTPSVLPLFWWIHKVWRGGFDLRGSLSWGVEAATCGEQGHLCLPLSGWPLCHPEPCHPPWLSLSGSQLHIKVPGVTWDVVSSDGHYWHLSPSLFLRMGDYSPFNVTLGKPGPTAEMSARGQCSSDRTPLVPTYMHCTHTHAYAHMYTHMAPLIYADVYMCMYINA